ncbi:MAG: hydroxysqualene dehydroxylase HpnE [Rhodospirillales bacterium]
MAATVHIVGAGLSGLAAAVDLAADGVPVILYEAAPYAGGRCRSYYDPVVGRIIDNGNHLVLSGNRAIARYLGILGVRDRLAGPADAEFPFLDVASGERWSVRPSAGPLPWWIFARDRRVPGSRPADYLAGLRLARAAPEETVAGCLGNGPLFHRFWEPLAVGVLNTPAEEGAAWLLWPVLRETFGRGAAACRPLIAREGLGHCFVEPALAFLTQHRATIRLATRVREIELAGDRITCLVTTTDRVEMGDNDVVILAVPAPVAADLVPVTTPDAHAAIVNGHFRLDHPASGSGPGPSLLGLVGGLCHWLFLRGDVASVTISAADHLLDQPAGDLAAAMWADVAIALGESAQTVPPCRVVREKRATFRQTPEQVARRPRCATRWSNLFLAGDWTDTGLPATLEGSVRSGNSAAAKAKVAAGRA